VRTLIENRFLSGPGSALRIDSFIKGFDCFHSGASSVDQLGFVFELLCMLGGHTGKDSKMSLAEAQAGITALYGDAHELAWSPEQIKAAFEQFTSSSALDFDRFASALEEKVAPSDLNIDV
jgi:hypothetical protein